MKKQTDKVILILSLLVCVLIITSAFFGLFLTDFYAQEKPNWRVQSRGQDAIDLFVIVPVLILTTIRGFSRKLFGTLLWAGTMVYIVYTYLIYCFDVRFNMFFIVYCLILGLSFYALVYFFINDNTSAKNIAPGWISNLTGIYFIIISLLFYYLWLSDVIPAIQKNTAPPSLSEVGLPTNPVHVIDLSVLLPGMFITGILLLRKNKLGLLLAPVLLTFFVLMDITIAVLSLFMYAMNVGGGLDVVGIMVVMTALSATLLLLYKRNLLSEEITS